MRGENTGGSGLHAFLSPTSSTTRSPLQSLSPGSDQRTAAFDLAPFRHQVEIPLKAIGFEFSWTTLPVTSRNRRAGTSKLKIKEGDNRYPFIRQYVWLEKYFSGGDYKRPDRLPSHPAAVPDTIRTL